MKQIYLNGRFLTQKMTGVQRYATELILSLDKILTANSFFFSEYRFTILVPRGAKYSLNLKCIKVKSVGFLGGYFWEQFELPFYSSGSLLLNFCNMAPLFKKNSVVTICDVSVFASPGGYSGAFLFWYKLALPIIGRMALSIITISDFSKAEIIRFLGVPEKKIERIYLGVAKRDLGAPSDAFLSRVDVIFQGKPFLLTVGSLNPNKNIGLLLKAINYLKDLDLKVAIVGGGNAKVFGHADLECPDFVEFFGHVSESELEWLYTNAALFIFPSLYEGFGLPPLEAMINGCPVLSSSAASLPEVCGNAAFYFNPFDASDLAAKIKIIIEDPEMQVEYRRRGMARISNFTWDKCAMETLNLIRKRALL